MRNVFVYDLGQVNLDELQAPLLGVPHYSHLNYSGSQLEIVLLDDPGLSDQVYTDAKVSTDAIVSSYVYGAHQTRLWDYVDNPPSTRILLAPVDIDFTIAVNREFHKVTTNVWKGDILEQIFYAEFDVQTQSYSVPVVKRTYEITYHPETLMIHVIETLAWYRRDGSLHPTTKAMHRYYTGQRYWVWWQGKREQTIEWLRHNVAMAMVANLLPQGWTMDQIVAEGHAFYDDHGSNIYAYTSGGGTGLRDAVTADTRTWLDLPWPWNPAMTIREKFLEQIAP